MRRGLILKHPSIYSSNEKAFGDKQAVLIQKPYVEPLPQINFTHGGLCPLGIILSVGPTAGVIIFVGMPGIIGIRLG